MRLLDAALQLTDYTDEIDTLGIGPSKAKSIVHHIRELCAIVFGLVLAADYKQGQELNAHSYQKVLELGRRLVYLPQVRFFSPYEQHQGCVFSYPFCGTAKHRKFAT